MIKISELTSQKVQRIINDPSERLFYVVRIHSSSYLFTGRIRAVPIHNAHFLKTSKPLTISHESRKTLEGVKLLLRGLKEDMDIDVPYLCQPLFP